MTEQRLQTRWAFPLRDSSAAHIAYYFHYHRLAVLSSLALIRLQRTASTLFPPSSTATLDSASESLIARLDAQYRQTVSNVLRTMEKIDRPQLTARRCALCGHATEYAAVASNSSPPSAASSQLLLDPACLPLFLCYDCDRGLCSPALSPPASLHLLLPLCVLHADCSAEVQQAHLEPQSGKSSNEPQLGCGDNCGTGSSDAFAVSPGPRRQHSRAEVRAQIAQFLLDEKTDSAARAADAYSKSVL
jgi:hypothetical protein